MQTSTIFKCFQQFLWLFCKEMFVTRSYSICKMQFLEGRGNILQIISVKPNMFSTYVIHSASVCV